RLGIAAVAGRLARALSVLLSLLPARRSLLGSGHHSADDIRTEVWFCQTTGVLDALRGQRLPAHVVGEIPGGRLRHLLRQLAFAQHRQQFFYSFVLVVALVGLEVERDGGAGIGFAVLEAHAGDFQSGALFRSDVKEAPAPPHPHAPAAESATAETT